MNLTELEAGYLRTLLRLSFCHQSDGTPHTPHTLKLALNNGVPILTKLTEATFESGDAPRTYVIYGAPCPTGGAMYLSGLSDPNSLFWTSHQDEALTMTSKEAEAFLHHTPINRYKLTIYPLEKKHV